MVESECRSEKPDTYLVNLTFDCVVDTRIVSTQHNGRHEHNRGTHPHTRRARTQTTRLTLHASTTTTVLADTIAS